MAEENKNRKVDFRIFIWAIGIILALFVWTFGGLAAINGRIDETNGDVSDMKVMLGEVKRDVGWIKDYFIENGFKE